MRTVAIVHFTGPPEVGGIETLLQAQVRALRRHGVTPRLILGRDGDLEGADVLVLPEIDPAHQEVSREKTRLAGRLPNPDHPLVAQIDVALRRALEGCSECWIHNVLTVYLNPFLTVAAIKLAREPGTLSWTAWCEDVTHTSIFQTPLLAADGEMARRPVPGMRYVTISASRRRELAAFFLPPAPPIDVIAPPLDAATWLDLTNETRNILSLMGLDDREPVVLVPSKVLPHKGLERVPAIGRSLRSAHPAALVLVSAAPSPHEPGLSASLTAKLRLMIRESGVEDTVVLLADVLGRPVSSSTVRQLMMLSDVVLLPSVEEGFGMPLREAGLLRVPVVCSDIPPFREAAAGVVRFFTATAAPDDIARTIAELAGGPGTAGRRTVLRSMSDFERRIGELLEQL